MMTQGGMARIVAAVLAVSAPALAAPGWSWNLSRDMIIDDIWGMPSNPYNAWSYRDTTGPVLLGPYIPGPTYGIWPSPFGPYPLVGLPLPPGPPSVPWLNIGVPIMHPDDTSGAMVRWTNTLNVTIKIRILARVTHADPNGAGIADGVRWHVDRNGVTQWSSVLQSTNMNPVHRFGPLLQLRSVGGQTG